MNYRDRQSDKHTNPRGLSERDNTLLKYVSRRKQDILKFIGDSNEAAIVITDPRVSREGNGLAIYIQSDREGEGKSVYPHTLMYRDDVDRISHHIQEWTDKYPTIVLDVTHDQALVTILHKIKKSSAEGINPDAKIMYIGVVDHYESII